MPDSRDDSGCECVNYVGCDPDCVDRTVPEGGDDYPVGTLSSEPLCVITDDMTYQEKIDALSGTIYDYDDVIDNKPGYFDYDDPHDFEEWYGCDSPVEGELWHNPYQSDIAGGGTIFSQAWSCDRSTDVVFVPKLTVTEVGDRPSSIGQDRPGDPAEKSHIGPLLGLTSVTRLPAKLTHGSQVKPGIRIYHYRRDGNETNVTRTPVLDDTEVGDQPSLSVSDRPRKTELHQTEFGVECGYQSICATHAPERDDAGDPLLSGTDSPGKTELYRTEFGAEFGAWFPEVGLAPAPLDTEGGDRSPLARPHLLGDPGGTTDSDRTVPHCVTGFVVNDYTEGTFPFESNCVVTDEMIYQERIEASCGTLDECDILGLSYIVGSGGVSYITGRKGL